METTNKPKSTQQMEIGDGDNKPTVSQKNTPKKGDQLTEQTTTTPEKLLELAITSGADIDKLEKLMALQERFQKQQAEKAFNIAMNEFQANKPELVKTKKVSFGSGKTSYSYNPLPKIQKAVDPVLSKFGLSYKWEQTNESGKIRITCIVCHVDGHCQKTWLESEHDTSGSKNNIQALGSTTTYLKRYTLENALGLSSDDDDDGQVSGEELIESTRKQIQNCNDLDELMLLYESLPDSLKNNKSILSHLTARKTVFNSKPKKDAKADKEQAKTA